MPDSTGQGMSVGDAVLQFIADTQNLDAGIDKVGAKVEQGMARSGAAVKGLENTFDSAGVAAQEAGEQIEDAMTEKATPSIREARGEAMLLGEAFGVHLPRHVTSFVATLPGVGEALESAFAATAVLFIIDAVIKLTEKFTSFIDTAVVYTDQMKAADAATADLNGEIIKQEAALAAAKKEFDEVGKSALELAKIRIADNLSGQLDEINKHLTDENSKIQQQSKWWKDALFSASDYFLGTTKMADQALAAYQETKNNEAQAAKATEIAKQTAAEQTATVVKETELKSSQAAAALTERNLATFNRIMFEQKMYAGQLAAEYDKMVDSIMKLPTATSGALTAMVPTLIQVRDALSTGQQAAHDMGVTLKSDLEKELDIAKTKLDAFTKSGIQDAVALNTLQQDVKDAAKAIEQYGKDQQKASDYTVMGANAVKAFGSDLTSAFIAAAAGEEQFAQAVEKAIGKALQALGQQCEIKAMAAVGDALMGDPSAWAAAAEYSAAAVACGVAGAMISGAAGGGSSSNGSSENNGRPGQVQLTGSGTESQQTTTNVQRFAAGGLVTAPTLAMIGDSPSGGSQSEAVLPLENDEVMGRLADHIMERMSGTGGGGHTFNMRGHFSKSELKEIAKKISKGVGQGTMLLRSSQTFQHVRRGGGGS